MAAYSEVFVWGADHFGQLGLGKKETGKRYSLPRCGSFNALIKRVSCGEEHAAFIAADGYVYSMGSNAAGRLGIGDFDLTQSSSPCLVEGLLGCVDISCGWGHTVAVTEDGKAFSWGVGDYGALGLGHTESQWVPTPVKMAKPTRQVSCGSRHTALLAGHHSLELYTCGAGEAGQLGTGRREIELMPVLVKTEPLKKVASGVSHTLLLTERGAVFAFGGNSFGQLGVGHKKSTCLPLRVQSLDNIQIKKLCASTHSAALTEGGDLYVWGASSLGEFLQPHLFTQFPEPLKDFALGGSFVAALDLSDNMWTWGNNTHGELGIGDFLPQSSPTPVVALEGKLLKQFACGGGFVIAIGSDVYESGSLGSSSPIKAAFIGLQRTVEARRPSPLRAQAPKALLSDRSALDNTPKRPIFQLEDERSMKSDRSTLRSIASETGQVALGKAIRRDAELKQGASMLVKKSNGLKDRQPKQSEQVLSERLNFSTMETRLRDLEETSTCDKKLLAATQKNLAEAQRHTETARREVSRLCSLNATLQRRIVDLEANLNTKRGASIKGGRERMELDRVQEDLEWAEDSRADSDEPAWHTNAELLRSEEETENELNLRSAKIAALTIQNERLKLNIEALEADLAKSKHRKLEVEKRIQKEVSTQITEARKKLEAEKTQLELKITKLTQDLEDHMQARRNAEADAIAKTQSMHDMEAAYREQTQKLNRMTQKYHDGVDELDRNLEALRGDRNRADGRAKELASLNAALQDEVSSLETAIHRAQDLERDLELTRRELISKDDTVTRLTRELESLKRDFTQQRRSISEARKIKDDAATAQNYTAKRQLTTIRDKYEAQIIELERKVKETTDETQRQRVELINEQTVRLTLERIIEALRAQSQDVGIMTEGANAQRRTYEAEIEKLKSELSQVQALQLNEASARSVAERLCQESNKKNGELETELELIASTHNSQTKELDTLKLQCSNFRYALSESQEEIDRLHLQLIEHLGSVDRLTKLLEERETKYRQVADENLAAKERLAEVEAKNCSLLEDLERAIAKTALDFKDSSANVLSTPIRIKVPETNTPGRAPRWLDRENTENSIENYHLTRAQGKYEGIAPENSEAKYLRGAFDDLTETYKSISPLRSQLFLDRLTPPSYGSKAKLDLNIDRPTPSRLDEIKARLASLHFTKTDSRS